MAPKQAAPQFSRHINAAEEHRVNARAASGNIIGGFKTLIRLDDHMKQ